MRVGVSEPVAAARLKELVAAGLLERVPYQEPGQRRRLEYRLTPMGEDFFPVLAALMQWGDRWLGPAGSRSRTVTAGRRSAPGRGATRATRSRHPTPSWRSGRDSRGLVPAGCSGLS